MVKDTTCIFLYPSSTQHKCPSKITPITRTQISNNITFTKQRRNLRGAPAWSSRGQPRPAARHSARGRCCGRCGPGLLSLGPWPLLRLLFFFLSGFSACLFSFPFVYYVFFSFSSLASFLYAMPLYFSASPPSCYTYYTSSWSSSSSSFPSCSCSSHRILISDYRLISFSVFVLTAMPPPGSPTVHSGEIYIYLSPFFIFSKSNILLFSVIFPLFSMFSRFDFQFSVLCFSKEYLQRFLFSIQRFSVTDS